MNWVIAAGLVLFGLKDPLVVSRVEHGQARSTVVGSRITVTVPQQDADLLVNDTPVGSAGNAIRTFDSAPLEPGKVYTYRFTARWSPNTYTAITRSATAEFRGGDIVSVDLTEEDPNDRVRVRYVPTPEPIVAEMIAFAGINQDDVVFEPGCGDARITIAAVKAGARRGVGIGIDPGRVAESKQNVNATGLGTKIDIRLGDALDIRDLSDATVVFMYMGDEFGRMMKPVLVEQLKVGSRIVSHRFTLGDWPPDRTVTVTDLGIPYFLHLWTVTQEVKDKAGIAARREAKPLP